MGPMLAALMAAAVGADRLLKEQPMLLSHDAATGYIASRKDVIAKWTVTQSTGFAGQLDCGARAFDMRSKVSKDGSLIMHHGAIDVPKKVEDAARDVVGWLANHPTEMVVFVGGDCDGANCTALFEAAMKSVGIASVGCGELATLTVSAARKKGALPSGGAALAFPNGCSESNYEPSVTCYPPYKYHPPTGLTASHSAAAQSKNLGAILYSCYQHDGPQAFAAMDAYLNYTSARDHATGVSGFSQLQALWQESADTVTRGVVDGSSLLLDQRRSKLNAHILEGLRAGWFPYVSLLEVNDVCDQGNAIREELLKR